MTGPLPLGSRFLLAAALLAPGTALAAEQPAQFACPGAPFDTALVADAAGLHGWPGKAAAWTAASGSPAALACATGRVALGWDRGGRRGQVIVLEQTGDSWRETSAIPVRVAPRAVTIAGSRVAAVVPGSGKDPRDTLVIADTDGKHRSETSLPGVASALAASPDGTAVLVGVGRDLRTFRADTGGTWVVFAFPEPIVAIGVRPDVPWLLVGTGSRVARVDLRDPSVRGVLPERAHVTLPGRVTWIGWLDAGGRAAVAVTADPPAVVTLSGADLAVVRSEKPPSMPLSVAVLAPDRVGWVGGGEMHATVIPPDALDGARAPHDAPLPRAAGDLPLPDSASAARTRLPGNRAAAAAGTGPATVPSDLSVGARPPAAPAPAPTPAPATPAPAPTPSTPPPTAAASPGGTVASTPAPPTPVPAAPAPLTPTASKPAASTPAAPAPIAASPAPAPAVVAPPAAAPVAPRADAPAPSPTAAAAPATAAVPTPPASAPAVAAPAAPAVADVLPAELPSGTVAGVLSGRMDLVQEILVAGPDNIFAERARIRPQRNGNSAVYRLDGLPPGHYRLAPMGPGGASLATKPTIANVTVGTGAGTRVDFTVLAPL